MGSSNYGFLPAGSNTNPTAPSPNTSFFGGPLPPTATQSPASNQFFNPLPSLPQLTPGVAPPAQAGQAVNQQGQGPAGGPTGGIQYGTNPLGNNMVGEIPIDPALTQALLGYLSQNIGKGATPFDLSTLLPSTGQATTPGQLNAPLTPTLQDLQEFLRTGKSSNPALQNYMQIATTGKPTDVGPAWDAMVAAQQRNIDTGAADIREQFAFGGGLASSPFGTAEADYQEQARKDQNATLALMHQQAQEAATGRQATADQHIADLQSQLGQIFQGMDQQAINNVLQEFIRTQPEYGPLLNMLFGAAFSYPPVERTQTGIGTAGAILGGAGSLLGGVASLIPAIAGVIPKKNPAANPQPGNIGDILTSPALGGGAALAAGGLPAAASSVPAGTVPPLPPGLSPDVSSAITSGPYEGTDLTNFGAPPSTPSPLGDPSAFDPFNPQNPFTRNFYSPDVAGGAASAGAGFVPAELPITTAGGFQGPTLSEVASYAPSFDASGAPVASSAASGGAGGAGGSQGGFLSNFLNATGPRAIASGIALGAEIPLAVLAAMGIGPDQIFKGVPTAGTQKDIAEKQNTVLQSTMRSGSGTIGTILSTPAPYGGKDAATKFLDSQYSQYVQGMQKWMQDEKWDAQQAQGYIDDITSWYKQEQQKIAAYQSSAAPQNVNVQRATQQPNTAQLPPALQQRLAMLRATGKTTGYTG